MTWDVEIPGLSSFDPYLKIHAKKSSPPKEKGGGGGLIPTCIFGQKLPVILDWFLHF